MAIYYVDSVAGLDANDGLSEGEAWATLAKLATASVAAGDSLLLKAGSVFAENFGVAGSGQSGSPITLAAYGVGAKPIFNQFPAFYRSWWDIIGVQMTTTDNSALRLGACKNINLTDCHFDGAFANHHTVTVYGYDIANKSEDIVFLRCSVADAGDALHGAPWEVGFSIQKNSINVTLNGCVGENCTDNNFQIYSGNDNSDEVPRDCGFSACSSLGSRRAHGFELGTWAEDCWIERCLVDGPFHDKGITCSTAVNPRVESNVIYTSTEGAGISVGGCSWALIQNNTIISREGQNTYKGIWCHNGDVNTTVRNNIVFFNNPEKFFPQLIIETEPFNGLVVDNNSYFNAGHPVMLGRKESGVTVYYEGLAAWRAATGLDAGSLDVDPQLAGYRLAPASPCIGAGDSSVLPLNDYYGDAFTSPINMGAAEEAFGLSNPQNTPEPDGATLTIESNSDLGTLYSYSKTTPFNGTEAEDAAEIMANGVGQAPVVGTNTRVVTGQDVLADHYAGWVQDSDGYGADFVTVWRIANDGDSLTLPGTASGYNFDIDWGDGTVETGLTTVGAGPHVYDVAGDYTVRVSGVFPRLYNGSSGWPQLLRLLQLGDVSVTSWYRGFINATNAIELNVGPVPQANAAYVETFMSWTDLVTPPIVDGLITSDTTNANSTFRLMTAMVGSPDFSSFDMSNVTTIEFMMAQWGTDEVDCGIDQWQITSMTTADNFMLGSKLSTAAYDATLASWGNQTLAAGASTTTIHFGTSQYSLSSQGNRDLLEAQVAGIIDSGVAP